MAVDLLKYQAGQVFLTTKITPTNRQSLIILVQSEGGNVAYKIIGFNGTTNLIKTFSLSNVYISLIEAIDNTVDNQTKSLYW
jgi:hypothetical protein